MELKILIFIALSVLSVTVGASQSYKTDMSKSEQKALKTQVADEWGRPTFTHSSRVAIFQTGSYTVKWKRYDSEKWEYLTITPDFRIKTKFQANITNDWISRVATSHFQDRFYIVRNDHDFIDAAWAAAEHFERFTKLIGVPAEVDQMGAIDAHGRKSVVKYKGRAMTKPDHFSQIETGKK